MGFDTIPCREEAQFNGGKSKSLARLFMSIVAACLILNARQLAHVPLQRQDEDIAPNLDMAERRVTGTRANVLDEPRFHGKTVALVRTLNQSLIVNSTKLVENKGGFIHIGKTAGSTISVMLKNGCHSFMPHPCRNVTNESAVSMAVKSYYHVPDFRLIPTSDHDFYIISVRDPFDRAVSSFLYLHPENLKALDIQMGNFYNIFGPRAYACFPTLEDFAQLQPNEQSTPPCSDYVHKAKTGLNATNCAALACAILQGQVRVIVHLYFNYRNILSKIPPGKKIYVVRNEQFWRDWEVVNLILGQEPPIHKPLEAVRRNTSNLAVPVKRNISDAGRDKLCAALQSEYLAFFAMLQSAANLQASDIGYAVDLARRNCPRGVSFQSVVADTA